jgi:hypothetical protein
MPKKKRTKKTIRAIVMDRVATLGVSSEGKLMVREKPPSYRTVSSTLHNASREDRWNAYMEFVKEADGASEDTKRKVRKRLGLEGQDEILCS